MKLRDFIICTVVVLAVLVGAILYGATIISNGIQQKSDLGGAFALGERNHPNNDPATTTQAFLTASSTRSRFIVPIDDADLVDINLIAIASTSNTQFRWTKEFSNDYNNLTGVGTWYGGDSTSASSASTTHSVATQEDQWSPGISGTSTKNFSIEPAASKYMRLTFYTTVTNGSIHAQAVVRKPLAR